MISNVNKREERMNVDKKLYNNYVKILKNELVPALGCTEPIAIAYAAAKAREVLGEFPDHVVYNKQSNLYQKQNIQKGCSNNFTCNLTAFIYAGFDKRFSRTCVYIPRGKHRLAPKWI